MSVAKVIDDKYEIHREIKRGGFGLIYEGVDLTFGKPVAIKAVDPDLLGEAKYIDMFQAEALNIAQFSHHNIVHIFDIKRDASGQFYIIMEFIDGPDLGTLIKECRNQHRKLPTHLGIYVIAEACAGLDYAHNRRDSQSNEPLNIVHQDISPSNIMITRTGEVKLIDFGMANLRRKQPKNKKEIVIQGKLNYIVPELVKNSGQLDRRADIFALGLVLYEILTGERVLKQDTPEGVINTLMSGKLDLSHLTANDLPDKVSTIIHKALAIDPEKRYPTANHFYMDLMHQLIVTAPTADFMTELSEFINQAVPVVDSPASNGVPSGSSGSDFILNIEEETNETHENPDEEIESSATHVEEDASESRNGSMSPEHEKIDQDGTEESSDDLFIETDINLDTTEEIEQTADLSELDLDRDTTELADLSDSANKDTSAEQDTEDETAEIIDTVVTDPEVAEEPETENKDGIEDDWRNSIITDEELADSKEDTQESDAAPALDDGFLDEIALGEISDDKSEPEDASLAIDDKSQDSQISELEFSIQDEKQSLSLDEEIDAPAPQANEELKTIIDVVKLSKRSHLKSVLLAFVVFIVIGLCYTVYDVLTQKTSYGVALYDLISPPAAIIDSYPTGAQVYLDDVLLEQTTPVRIEKITPGVHKLMLVHPRFAAIVRSIHVPSKGELKIDGEDGKNPREPFIFNFNSKLNITSNPPGATIRINGVQLSSTTPTDVNWEISEEPIEIQLTKAGFPDLKGFSINPEDGSEIIPDRRFWKFSRNDNIKDDFNIEGIFHKFVDIKSVPSRAQIIINNSPVGTTGINGKVALTRGTHQLVLQKRGYLTKKRTITIDEATSDQLTEVLSRRVKLTVQNAATNDGTDIGAHIVSLRSNGKTSRINRTTPTNLTLLPYTYAAFLKKQGFQDKEIVIGRNQVNVEVTMDPVPAPVEIYIVDSITNQAIDQVEISYKLQETTEPEKSMGTANTQGELFVEIPPGMYQITVNKPGYQPVTKNLRVKSGRRNRLTFRIVTQ